MFFTHVCHSVGGGALYVASCLAAWSHVPFGGLCPWSHVPSKESLPGESLSKGGLCRNQKSVRYASYWNAFLLKTFFTQNILKNTYHISRSKMYPPTEVSSLKKNVFLSRADITTCPAPKNLDAMTKLC